MTLNPLPPQAYTKETLTKAFSWLQNQSKSIQELATTPDILVSLFLKAKMSGDASLDTPSITNFKAELKSLAGMMGEFESKNEPVPAATQAVPPMPKVEAKAPAMTPQASTPTAAMPTHSLAASYAPNYAASHPTSHVISHAIPSAQPHAPQAVSATSLQLDPRSQEMIAILQKEFNLSSDQEALRLLISVGFKKLTSI